MILGVTGLPGSGKSTLCGFFEKLGYCHLSADSIGHEVLDGPVIQAQLQEAFGPEVVLGGRVQRKRVAGAAFASQEKTETLNSILHPPIRKRILDLLQNHKKEGLDTCLEAALLCETGLVELCDWSLFLDCPFEVRLERVEQRGWGEDELKKRDARQDEGLKADASDLHWKGPHNLGSLQRLSLLLDIVFRYERACSSKEKANLVFQQFSQRNI